MSRSGCTVDEALDRLRSMSQTEHRKLPEIAQSVVEDAVRRARARGFGGGRRSDLPADPPESPEGT